MTTPREKLAASLNALKGLQGGGVSAIRSADLSRSHRERLLKAGFLQAVMKGWYIAARPDETKGDSTAWYASFWGFCAAYLNERFDNSWCLSPEQSLSLHAGNWAVPAQLVVRAPRARNRATQLLHNTSILDVRAAVPDDCDVTEKDGLRLFSLPIALVSCSPGYFANNPTDVRAALSVVRDASDVLAPLLEGSHSTVAGRLAGAFRNVGREKTADQILQTMRRAGYTVREHDPFDGKITLAIPRRELAPHASRLRLMWEDMRPAIIKRFPKAPGRPNDIDRYLSQVDEVYGTDAYHSLSIEGYRVSPELIERVRGGDWNPDTDEQDREHRDALAASGYWQAFQEVKKSLKRVLRGDNPGTVADDDHPAWYSEMFAPSVTAGVLDSADLAGYRSGPVHIRRSMHIPPSGEAVRDCMPAFFELLTEETDPAVRVVLGHFIFVYIHPYTDGNGRMGRFLMNVMLAADGYAWTVIPHQKRDAYMAALEQASVRQDIVPFTDFLARQVGEGLAARPAAGAPEG